MNDLISVIIPVKNGSKYIEQAINGILNQKMNVEIIVVDDCSADNTIEIAQNYGCKIVKHETSKGQVAGKNSGLKVAEGKYILFHDHDDIMMEGALQKLYEEFEPDFMAVEAKVQDWYSPDLSEEERAKTLIKQEPYWGLFTGAILIKKEVFDSVGYFSEATQTGEIIEWQSKMDSNNFKVKKIDFVSTLRRIHSTNFGKTNQKTEFKNYAAILRAKLKKNNP
ncbi:glycosyltransferase family 2 protein [bacterium]|nr:glycosyltransferase family 2 protein [bacterium]